MTMQKNGIWHDGTREYRISVKVDACGYERIDMPAEVRIDFQKLLDESGRREPVNDKSIRVVETDERFSVIDESVPFQFNRTDITDAGGELTFLLKGVTPACQLRHYHVYFSTNANCKEMEVESRIRISNVYLHGAAGWRFDMENAAYVYDRTGGGFSEMRDTDGADWIQYDNCPPPICYRGIPNLQTYTAEHIFKGLFHPGNGTVFSKMVSRGPLKVKIHAYTPIKLIPNGYEDTEWAMTYEIFPAYVRCTVLKGDKEGFGFLYEGVPGGRDFDKNRQYAMEADNSKTYFSENVFHNVTPKWVYFGDDISARTLFYAYHEGKSRQEKISSVFDALTVFGFGRESVPGIVDFPATFTLGFCESTEFDIVSKHINSMYRDLDISIRRLETKNI